MKRHDEVGLSIGTAIPLLDPHNFRVDSDGWREGADPSGLRFLGNPEGDAWEVLDGPLAGAQYFTFDAAMRETVTAGKRVPTKDEWVRIALARFGETRRRARIGMIVPIALELDLAGFRAPDSGRFVLQGKIGQYWSSDRLPCGWNALETNGSQTKPAMYGHRTFGFSVRCLADN